MGLSSALDLISPMVVDHHIQVTSYAVKIAEEMGLSDNEKSVVAMAAALHDIGAVSFNEELPMSFRDDGINRHADLGYLLLRDFPPLYDAAIVARFHHLHWNKGKGAYFGNTVVPLASHIVHLADRIAVEVYMFGNVLDKADGVKKKVIAERGMMFHPNVTDAFLRLADKEYFWLEALAPLTSRYEITSSAASWNIKIDLKMMLALSEMFRIIIDFRSRMTAAHSKSVAEVASFLGRMAGFSRNECDMLHIAGNLHDLGKLAIPVEVIEKATSLTASEKYLVRAHSYYTFKILSEIGGLEVIAPWAAFHHEHIDGSGYPFHLSADSLPLGSRIVAVSDIFCALTEDRTYRSGLTLGETRTMMENMATGRKLDGNMVGLALESFEELDRVRMKAIDDSNREFRDLQESIRKLVEDEVSIEQEFNSKQSAV